VRIIRDALLAGDADLLEQGPHLPPHLHPTQVHAQASGTGGYLTLKLMKVELLVT
jgi:hypothetical protein